MAIRKLTQIQGYRLIYRLIQIPLLVSVADYRSSIQTWITGAFTCHVPSVSFSLGQFLRLSSSFMTLIFWSAQASPTMACSSVWVCLTLPHDVCVRGRNATELLMYPFQGIVLGGTWHLFFLLLINTEGLWTKNLESIWEERLQEPGILSPTMNTSMYFDQWADQTEARPGL